MPEVKEGDWVAIHWNHLIEILKQKDLANLKKYTEKTIKLVNG